MKKKLTTKDIAKDILDLFQGEDTVQLLMRGGYPQDDIEPLDGLQLAANCLRECIGDVPSLGGETERHAKIAKALKKHAKEAADWFVVFYRLEGSATYHLGWSDDIDYCQAFNAVLGYIQYVTETVSYTDVDDLPDNMLPVLE